MGRNGSVKRSGSTGGSGAAAGPPTFTVNPGDYRLMEEVGYGAHAVVYRAIFVPRDEVVAVKCLDLDQLNNNIVSTCDTHPFPLLQFVGFSVAVWLLFDLAGEMSVRRFEWISFFNSFGSLAVAAEFRSV